jgi:hypothetical protein
MQDAHVKVKAGLPCQNSIQQEDYFHQQTGFKCKEETRKTTFGT